MLVVLGLLVAGLVAASRVTTGTSAAWTDDVNVRTDVSLGTWTATPQPPQLVHECVVRDATTHQVAPEHTCTMHLNLSLYPDGAQWGNVYWQEYQSQVTIGINAGSEVQEPVPVGYYVDFTARLPVGGQPDWWSWTGAELVGFQTDGQGVSSVSSRCAALPEVSGTLGAGSTMVQIRIRTAAGQNVQGPVLCQP
ncbi:hypothetical protein GC089_11190 [Cellulomonas sp. JZ18]|uniref:hypothetical protein n=1 Tax=Cellulomonas sp. JZ18 TaxID=2654191 RepID=UPI0012D43E53|nr:hypothetical protein [Cellulomonas sp. JZ18]QGQ19687.1 hypothetical protein GC089_11190 [Cellulomonas sp. JZ18]